jgi:hypothetical protein
MISQLILISLGLKFCITVDIGHGYNGIPLPDENPSRDVHAECAPSPRLALFAGEQSVAPQGGRAVPPALNWAGASIVTIANQFFVDERLDALLERSRPQPAVLMPPNRKSGVVRIG